jgi:hypothetical protein
VSIHAIPAGSDPPGGISVVSYTAGILPIRRPAARHTPSRPAADPPNRTRFAGFASGLNVARTRSRRGVDVAVAGFGWADRLLDVAVVPVATLRA